MSEENVRVVSQMYEALRRGDVEAALAYVDPAVVIDASHRVDGRVGHGRDELVAIVAEWLTTWDDWRQEIEAVHDLGDRVLVIETQFGRGKGSGADWEGRFGMLYEMRDNRMRRMTIYDDLSEALEAAGLSDT
jgi:ketosteroid isomerase-like protein